MKFSQICAKAVRQSLKADIKSKGPVQLKSDIKIVTWKDGVQTRYYSIFCEYIYNNKYIYYNMIHNILIFIIFISLIVLNF